MRMTVSFFVHCVLLQLPFWSFAWWCDLQQTGNDELLYANALGFYILIFCLIPFGCWAHFSGKGHRGCHFCEIHSRIARRLGKVMHLQCQHSSIQPFRINMRPTWSYFIITLLDLDGNTVFNIKKTRSDDALNFPQCTRLEYALDICWMTICFRFNWYVL